MITVAVEGKDKKREHHTTPADHRLLLHDIDLPARTDLFSFLHDAAHNCRVWGPYVLHDLRTSSTCWICGLGLWVGSVIYTDPAQPPPTPCEELDGPDHDLSDLDRDLSDLDRDLSDLDHDLSGLSHLAVRGVEKFASLVRLAMNSWWRSLPLFDTNLAYRWLDASQQTSCVMPVPPHPQVQYAMCRYGCHITAVRSSLYVYQHAET